MGLAAAESRLQPDHRLSAGTGQPRRRGGQDLFHSMCNVSDIEECSGVLIVGRRTAELDSGEVGGELRLAEPAGQNVGMRAGDSAPRFQAAGTRGSGLIVV